ncbi:MAG: ABC transporter permease [bacterium]|nr:ABC transporter permease [bacterium]
MRGLWLLSWRHVAHHKGQTILLVLCIALATFLPATLQILIAGYQADLTRRAAATPLIAGAKGNRFDLTLGALYFRHSELDTVPFGQLREIQRRRLGTAIPIHARFTARSAPVVGTSVEYFELRRLQPVAGTLPLRIGDAVLGHNVATELGLTVGGEIGSDPTDLYDLAKPPTLRLQIVGVLPMTGGADDDAVFVDLKTCWVLEGLAHGHADVQQIDSELVIAQSERVVNVSPALRSSQRVDEANIDSFHAHGDPDELPLSAIIVAPHDVKSATLLKARINASKTFQMVVPSAVIEDLLRFVFRIKVLFDGFAIVLGASTLLLLGLQVWLSMRLRRREMETLHRIGCSPGSVVRLYAIEVGWILGLGIMVAATLVVVTIAVLPNLLRAA